MRDDQGNPDIGDYQMLAVTAIAVGVYVTQILGFLGSIQLLHHVTIPDVDSTILATFGLGQGAYLVKKHSQEAAICRGIENAIRSFASSRVRPVAMQQGTMTTRYPCTGSERCIQSGRPEARLTENQSRPSLSGPLPFRGLVTSKRWQVLPDAQCYLQVLPPRGCGVRKRERAFLRTLAVIPIRSLRSTFTA
jgi:hypothetical protein